MMEIAIVVDERTAKVIMSGNLPPPFSAYPRDAALKILEQLTFTDGWEFDREHAYELLDPLCEQSDKVVHSFYFHLPIPAEAKG